MLRSDLGVDLGVEVEMFVDVDDYLRVLFTCLRHHQIYETRI